MLEILFRGKTKDGGKWVEGGLISVDDCEHGTVTAIIPHNCEAYRFNISGEYVDTETVGQFTGLTDKNGKKIFDGDIIKTEEYDREVIYMVVYSSAAFMLHNRRKWRYMIGGGEYEVIGNVHDNPELFEEVNRNA